MRLATYNFLSGGSARRNMHWQLVRNVLRPDILLAQECRPVEPLPNERVIWQQATAKGWGTALYARDVDITAIPIPEFIGWVIGANVSLHGLQRPLRVFSIHCPAGAGGYVRVMHRILDALAPYGEDADMVFGGDLNVVTAYRTPDDVVRMSKGERELLDRIHHELGMVSSWQAANPGAPLPQTLRWQANRDTPYHCDGIFVPVAWTDSLSGCEVRTGAEWELLSDHNPVCCEVRALKLGRAYEALKAET